MRVLLGFIIGMMVMMNTCTAFADDDYHQRNFFNQVSDWSVTFWRSPDEKERIVNERIEARAHWRQKRHDAHDHNH